MQYDLFQDDEIEELQQQLDELRGAQSNMRKGLFARHNELQKMIEQIRNEFLEFRQIKINKKAEVMPFFGEYIESVR
jgi:hypothetical protein